MYFMPQYNSSFTTLQGEKYNKMALLLYVSLEIIILLLLEV